MKTRKERKGAERRKKPQGAQRKLVETVINKILEGMKQSCKWEIRASDKESIETELVSLSKLKEITDNILKEYPEEVYDLNKYTEKDRMILFEYIKGYSEKGYYEMCKTCAGYWGTNRNIVKAAEQEQ